MTNFDLFNAPLEGTNLIEASAGTGKTYTISGIFIRLLLEMRLSVAEILVVTYTEAATEELRDRIRFRLREALKAFTAGQSADPFLDCLIRRLPDTGDGVRLLQDALHDFDLAPVFTIHGFCGRMLRENAFESGSFFDTELIPDQSALEEEIVCDFWRLHFYNAPFEFVSHARSQLKGPQSFLELIRGLALQPDLRIVPEPGSAVLESLQAFRDAFAKLRQAWPRVRDEVVEKLKDPGLNKKYYADPLLIVGAMDAWTSREAAVFPISKEVRKFSAKALERFTKKNHQTPLHPFFELCRDTLETGEALEREMDERLLFLKKELFPYVRTELAVRKERLNVESFDDLLIRLRAALVKPEGAELAGALRKRFRAALVDEFQDTDPVQYAIFRNVFEHGESILFLIGDPKQAIYSFRGADLFAYMKAAGHIEHRYTLGVNWRSDPGLIGAVNTLFAEAHHPFVYETICFLPVSAPDLRDRPAESPSSTSLRIEGHSEPPLQICFADGSMAGNPGGVLHKAWAYEKIPAAVAAEIARLIRLGRQGKAKIGERPVREADIAVLVRKNKEARHIQEALAALRIPSVLHSMENVFDTREALEMERVLAAIAEPDREDLLRTALVSDMLGMTGEELEALSRDDSGWEVIVSRFRNYYEAWDRGGFIRMFRRFISEEKVRARLLSFPDGERRLTNILHLSEIVHKVSFGGKLGITMLVKWISRQRDPGTPRLEEHQLRLESDAEAVKIVTIHKSKGLEYPIVFCPFNWAGASIPRAGTFSFHDELDDWKLNVVIDPKDDRHRLQAEKELLAENLRLFYVALTRARSKCYLVWGRFRDAGTSALCYLFHFRPAGRSFAQAAGNTADMMEMLGQSFDALTEQAMRGELENLAGKSSGTITVSDLMGSPAIAVPSPSSGEEPVVLQPRKFGGFPERDWRVASFSSLVLNRLAGSPAGVPDLPAQRLIFREERPDHDYGFERRVEISEETSPQEALCGMFGFPRGARAGTLLHRVFESVDFARAADAQTGKMVEQQLEAHGFDLKWREPVCRMIADVLACPLDPACRDLELRRIPSEGRLSELEFYFPLRRVSPDVLKGIFSGHGFAGEGTDFQGRIGALNFQPARGYMKGFIDLVFRFADRFYLIDWKSNFLGSTFEDYAPPRLAETMAEEFYVLQYHIYALALDLYLRTRIPDYDYGRHFGGVFYIFLRGVSAEHGPRYGIYRAKPSGELIESLREHLLEAERF